MPSPAVLQADIDRASSDYIAVSRQAGLFDVDAYERAEEAAWARLVAALEALSALTREGAGPGHTETEQTCTASR